MGGGGQKPQGSYVHGRLRQRSRRSEINACPQWTTGTGGSRFSPPHRPECPLCDGPTRWLASAVARPRSVVRGRCHARAFEQTQRHGSAEPRRTGDDRIPRGCRKNHSGSWCINWSWDSSIRLLAWTASYWDSDSILGRTFARLLPPLSGQCISAGLSDSHRKSDRPDAPAATIPTATQRSSGYPAAASRATCAFPNESG
jgi:hypothetical protein